MIDIELFNYDPLGYMASDEFKMMEHFCDDLKPLFLALDYVQRHGPDALQFSMFNKPGPVPDELRTGAFLLSLQRLKTHHATDLALRLNTIFSELPRGWERSSASMYSEGIYERFVPLLERRLSSAAFGSSEWSLVWWLLHYHGIISVEKLAAEFKKLNSTFAHDLPRHPTYKSSTAAALGLYLRRHRLLRDNIDQHIRKANRLVMRNIL